jgi:hypothetical protein
MMPEAMSCPAPLSCRLFKLSLPVMNDGVILKREASLASANDRTGRGGQSGCGVIRTEQPTQTHAPIPPRSRASDNRVPLWTTANPPHLKFGNRG